MTFPGILGHGPVDLHPRGARVHHRVAPRLSLRELQEAGADLLVEPDLFVLDAVEQGA